MMGRTTGFHDDSAALLLREERDQLVPAQLAPDLRLPGLIHCVNLKSGLGGIKMLWGGRRGDGTIVAAN